MPADLPPALERAFAPTDDIRALIGALDLELSETYSAEQQHGLKLEHIFQPEVRFFIARIGGTAVGCGGVALGARFAELKRMYVRPTSRGQGVADALIARLIAEAAEAGLSVIRLETGVHQPAALRFYQRHGFETCPAFGAYVSMPPNAIATSVFMEKILPAT